MDTAIIIREAKEQEVGLEVGLIYDALVEVEERKEEFGPEACMAIDEAARICVRFISEAEEYRDRRAIVRANNDLLEQAERIRQNQGALSTSVSRVLSAKPILAISAISSFSLSYAWSEFTKGLFTFYRVATGSLGGAVSTLAAIKDVKDMLPENASWSDYLKFAAYSKQPLIGESSEIVESIVEQLSQDPKSVFYMAKDSYNSYLSDASKALPTAAAIATAAIPYEQTNSIASSLIENGMSIFSSVISSAKELAKDGFKAVYRHEFELIENQIETLKQQKLLEIRSATKDIKTSIHTIHSARNVVQGTLTALLVIFIILMVYIVYKTCVNEMIYAKDRKRQRESARRIVEVLDEFDGLMENRLE
jgi:hypothetical protein